MGHPVSWKLSQGGAALEWRSPFNAAIQAIKLDGFGRWDDIHHNLWPRSLYEARLFFLSGFIFDASVRFLRGGI